MIRKIIAIKNVGKFRDYDCTGDVALNRMNLVYAENAAGKTTLSAILRSLKTGDGAPILERQTLGQDSDPEVRILLETGQCRFLSNSWDRIVSEIEVFDPVFVCENVYAGESVEYAHKRNLYQFAIGEEAVNLAQEVDALNNKISEITSEIRDKEQKIRPYISSHLSVEDFVGLEAVSDIEEKIGAKNRELEAIKQSEQIAGQSSLNEILLPRINADEYSRILRETLQSISEGGLAKAQSHFKDDLSPEGENWVNKGMAYIKDDECPFCGASLKGKELVLSYRLYFSEDYDKLKRKIQIARGEIEEKLAEEKVGAVTSVISTNKLLLDFWGAFIPSVSLEISASDIETVWAKVRGELNRLFDLKTESPLEVIEPGKAFYELIAEYDERVKEAREYNAAVNALNVKIGELKDRVTSADRNIIVTQLNTLKYSKERFSDRVSALCDDYENATRKNDSLNEEKRSKWEKLEETTKEILEKYQTAINRHLERFGAGFKITETEEQRTGGKPSLNYRISINEIPVDLENRTPLEPKPCFGNTLSSGDKTSLAFAFFMARLDLDDDLNKKVLIFDDPISSLDIFRKNYTQQQLLKLSQLAKQNIIMSHDPYFLRRLWESADKSDIKTLNITRTGTSSVITEWDCERATESEYYRNYNALEKYLDKGPVGDPRFVARCIRPLLEGNLRISFAGRFGPGVNLGGMIKEIRNAPIGDSLTGLKALEGDLSNINEYAKGFHHGDNPDAYTHPITDQELSSHINLTLKTLSRILAAKYSQ